MHNTCSLWNSGDAKLPCSSMEKLYADIDLLLKKDLSIEEALFFASMTSEE